VTQRLKLGRSEGKERRAEKGGNTLRGQGLLLRREGTGGKMGWISESTGDSCKGLIEKKKNAKVMSK